MPNSFRAAYAVPVGSGGVILGSGGNVYHVVHQNPRPTAAETQTVQIISGSQLHAINGQIVTKAVQQQQQLQQQQPQMYQMPPNPYYPQPFYNQYGYHQQVIILYFIFLQGFIRGKVC